MARNLQVIRKKYSKRYKAGFTCFLLAAAVSALLTAGCSKKEAFSDAYDIDTRIEYFAPEERSPYAKAFADDISVITGPDDAEPSITGEAAAVFSLDGGTALFHKNAYESVNPASTTKIMTALIALRYGNLDDMVTCTDAVIINEAGSSMAGVEPGDVISLNDLLYGLLIPSGNDAANAIAVHMAGSVSAFADLMNAEAKRIGATGTHFSNANGLTDPDHYTTAYDLYLIFNEAMKYDKFREIISADAYTAVYTDADGEKVSKTWNTGNLYRNGSVETPVGLTVIGGKTGTTNAAKYCLIMAVEDQDGREYASVVMKADTRTDLYNDMSAILSTIGR